MIDIAKSWDEFFGLRKELSNLLLIPSCGLVRENGYMLSVHPVSDRLFQEHESAARKMAIAAKELGEFRAKDWNVPWEVRRVPGGSVVPNYGLLMSEHWPAAKYGLFQVAHDPSCGYDEKSIIDSCIILADWVDEMAQRGTQVRVDLAHPTQLLGGMGLDEVGSTLTYRLPHTVRIVIVKEKQSIW